MLSEGLDQYTISISNEFLEKLKTEFQETSDEEQLKVLLEKLLVPIIDSKFILKKKKLLLMSF